MAALAAKPGESSGPVPSRSLSARPTRSRILPVAAVGPRSFMAAWISAAVHPGNAPLTADFQYFPDSRR